MERAEGDARSSPAAAAGMASIIVPTFNGSRFLATTLDSLNAQRYRDFEVIVVDDGSTDDSVAVARAHPLAPIVIEQQNHGVAVARNRGMAAARGDWVAFLDQDDLWHRDRLATLMRLAVETGSSAVATTESRFAREADRARLAEVGDGRDSWPTMWITDGQEAELVSAEIEDATREVNEITLDRLLEGASMLTTTVMYRRDLAISAGGCAPHARALDDHVLNVNVARIAGPISRIDSRELLYRVHPASTSTVSPMVGPFLSTQAAIRLGGVFSREVRTGPNVEHLLFGLAKSDLPALEQLALLTLATKPKSRSRWVMRWLTRRLGIR
jgi:Glycosyl transferase family 2